MEKINEETETLEPIKKTPVISCPKTHFKIRKMKEVLAMGLPPIKDIVKDLFQESSIIIIAGTPGSFKTGFVTFFALCCSEKKEMLGMPIPKKLKILFIDEENGFRRINQKLARLAKGMGVTEGEVYFTSMSGFKINRDWVEQLEKLIIFYKPDVVIMDSLIRILEGSERDEKDISKIHNLLKPLVDKYNLTIIILHHLRKQDIPGKWQPRTLDDIRGSSDLGGLCDQAFLIDHYRNEGDDTKIFKMISLKEKDKMNGRGFNFKVKGKDGEPLNVLFGGWIDENISEYIEKVKGEILEYFKANGLGPHRTKEIVETLRKEAKIGKDAVYKALSELVKDGILDGSKYGHYSLTTMGKGAVGV